MGSRVQSIVGLFRELCFLLFSAAQVLVGLRKQFINNFVFLTFACADGFNNKNNVQVHFIFLLIEFHCNFFISH